MGPQGPGAGVDSGFGLRPPRNDKEEWARRTNDEGREMILRRVISHVMNWRVAPMIDNGR